MKSDTSAKRTGIELTNMRVRSSAVTYSAHAMSDMIAYAHAQVLLVDSRAVRVTVSTEHWTVRELQAIWIPAFTFHKVEADAGARTHILSIPRRLCGVHFPAESRLIEPSAFLRHLIYRLAEAPVGYERGGFYGRIATLLLEDLDWTPVQNTQLPRLRDPRLLRIQQALLENPADRRTLQQWSEFTHTSCRTLARLFQKEANACFCDWRNQLRLSVAIPMLRKGGSVIAVALSVGFEGGGTFTTMFRQYMGMSPSQYLQQAGTEEEHS